MRAVAVLFFLCLMYCLWLPAQDASMVFQQLNSSKGFNQSVCYSVLKDREGFVWITTINGLYRYDGVRYMDASRGNNELKGHALVSIAEDRNADLWLSRFNDELIYYDRRSGLFEIMSLKSMHPGIAGDIGSIRFLKVDGQNQLWLYLNDWQLAAFDCDTRKLLTFQAPEGMDAKIQAHIVDDDIYESVFYASDKGSIARGRLNERMELVWDERKPQLSNSAWGDAQVAFEAPGLLWIPSDTGLQQYRWDDNSYQHYTQYKGEALRLGSSKWLLRDAHGSLWMPAEAGMYRFHMGLKKFTAYTRHDGNDPYSIAGEAIPLLHDEDDVLWCSVYGKGISYSKLGSIKLRHELRPEQAALHGHSNYLRAMASDSRGRVLCATQEGEVLLLDSNYRYTSKVIHRAPAPYEHIINARDGSVWMAGSKLTQYHPHSGELRHFSPGGASPPAFTTIYELPGGNLLLGSYSDLQEFDILSGTFARVAGIEERGAYCALYTLGNGQLISCRRDQGVSIYTPEAGGYRLLKVVDPYLFVKCITRSSSGALLFATTVGIYTFDESALTLTALEHINSLLPDPYVYSMLQDVHGAYWASTNNGLCRWNEGGINFKSFSKENGLQDLEFNTNAHCIASNGDLLFGGVNGLNVVDSTLPQNFARQKPRIQITSVSSKDMELNPGQFGAKGNALTIGTGRNAIEIEYVALEYFNPQKVKVRHRLLQHDDAWQPGDNYGTVRYANVAPGSYQFEISGTDADGIWQEEVLSMGLVIQPFWWQTWWSRSLLVLGMLALIIFAVKAYSNAKLRKQREAIARELAVQVERERITADLHDDIGGTLSSMYLFGDLADRLWKEQPDESKRMLGTITTQSRELVQRMSDIVWSLKSAGDHGGSISLRLRNYAHELLSANDLVVRFEIDEALDAQIVNPLMRKNLLLIAKEALNNAAKYSEASSLIVSLQREGASIHLRISDNGAGFAPEASMEGNGLGNMRQRSEKMGGKLHIVAAPGQGCTVLAQLPMATISQGKVP